MKRLFLFDIDGTLMRGAGRRHGDMLVEAVRRVVGAAVTIDGIPVHGMLDMDIVAAMLANAGHAADRVDEIAAVAQEIYPADCPDLKPFVLPGVPKVLEEIAARGYPMGLVTGNLAAIGWTKVERAGLRQYFRFGAFSGMGRTRADLARLAFEMSGATGETVVTMVGDAPSDVRAAQANGFRVVSVATGLTPRDELAALNPDLLLNDLSAPADRGFLIGD
jgi:phosphoglycolate phosphatase-like HAD superfamily hydrolase